MAGCTFPCPASINHHHSYNRHTPPRISNYTTTVTAKPISLSLFSSYCSTISVHVSFPFNHSSRSGRCYATTPPSEPPFEKNQPPSSGAAAKLTKFQDTVQIFFAVLFWMSLFFWSCAWDGGNDGRPNKGPRFKK